MFKGNFAMCIKLDQETWNSCLDLGYWDQVSPIKIDLEFNSWHCWSVSPHCHPRMYANAISNSITPVEYSLNVSARHGFIRPDPKIRIFSSVMMESF